MQTDSAELIAQATADMMAAEYAPTSEHAKEAIRDCVRALARISPLDQEAQAIVRDALGNRSLEEVMRGLEIAP